MSRPATYFFMTVEGGRLVVKYDSTEQGAEVTRVIHSMQDYYDFFTSKQHEAGGDITVMCSSSMDFPEEYTEDADVVALCHSIRDEG